MPNIQTNKTMVQLLDTLVKKAEHIAFYEEILDEIQKDIDVNQNHDIPIAFFSPNTDIIYVNKNLTELLGYNQEEIIGKSKEFFLYKEDKLSGWNRSVFSLLVNSEKNMMKGQYILKTSSGQPLYFDLIYITYKHKGKIEFIKGIFNDKTAEVLATQKLISEKKKTEKILASGSLGYWVYNSFENTMSWSGNYENITGYQTDELPTTITDIRNSVHPNDINKINLNWGNITPDDYKIGIELRIKTKSGKYKWGLFKVISIENDQKTLAKIVSGIHIDIDNYKKTTLKIREKERQIIQNEENLKKIYKALPIGIIIYNSSGEYVESNDALLKIFGMNSKAEINRDNLFSISSHVSNLIKHYEYSIDIGYDLENKTVYPNYMSAPQSEYTKYINIRIISLLDSDGYTMLDSSNFETFHDNHEKRETETGYLLVATDNTILRKSELNLKMSESELKTKNIKLAQAKDKAQESDRLKSAFLANVSHEIRTPLNAIIGFSELIAMSDDKEEKDVYFDIVKTNNDILLALISNILDLSKIESGRINLEYTEVNIDEICRDLVQVFKNNVSTGVRLSYKLPESPTIKMENNECFIKQSVFLTDKTRLIQIYSNFINNAIKNTNHGEIIISYNIVEVNSNNNQILRTLSKDEAELIIKERSEIEILHTKKDTDNSHLMIACSVSDTGIGIPEDKFDQIFNRFTKLNNDNAGFGLGLPIAKSLTEQMHGFIDIKSTMGNGSVFTACLPYNVSEKDKDIWYNCSEEKVKDIMDQGAEALTNNNLQKIEAKNIEVATMGNNSLIENFEKLNIKLQKENISEDNTMSDKMLDILVAEDIDFNYMLIKAIIGKKHNLVRAKTGREAVDLFDKQKFNLILMDMKMPEMDGITATKLIREKDLNIPIIAVTAYAFDTDKQIALDAGCNTYIVKPVDPKVLIAEIDKYCQ